MKWSPFDTAVSTPAFGDHDEVGPSVAVDVGHEHPGAADTQALLEIHLSGIGNDWVRPKATRTLPPFNPTMSRKPSPLTSARSRFLVVPSGVC